MRIGIFRDLQTIFSPNNLGWLFVWSIIVSPFVYHTVLPQSWQETFSIPFFDILISPFLLPSLLLMLVMSFKKPLYPVLFGFAIFAIIWGLIAAAAVGRQFTYASLTIISIFSPFLFLSTNPIGKFETSYFKLLCFLLLFFTGTQMILTSLGLYEYTSATGRMVGTLDEIGRARTTIGAATGSSVMFFLFMVIGMYLSRFDKLMLFIYLGFGSVAIILSFTRGSMLMLGVLLGGLLIVRRIGNSTFSARYKVLILLVVASAGTYVLFTSPQIVTSVTDRFAQSGLHAWERTSRYMEAWDIFERQPMTGVGITVYRERQNLTPLYSLYLVGSTSPHNVYLLFLAEGGVFLGIALLGLCGYTFFKLLLKKDLFMAACCFSIFAVGHNLEVIYADPPWNFFWALFFALAHQSIYRRDPSDRPEERIPLPPEMPPPFVNQLSMTGHPFTVQPPNTAS